MNSHQNSKHKLLNLSSKLVPVLILSLVVLVGAGGRVSAAGNLLLPATDYGATLPDSPGAGNFVPTTVDLASSSFDTGVITGNSGESDFAMLGWHLDTAAWGNNLESCSVISSLSLTVDIGILQSATDSADIMVGLVDESKIAGMQAGAPNPNDYVDGSATLVNVVDPGDAVIPGKAVFFNNGDNPTARRVSFSLGSPVNASNLVLLVIYETSHDSFPLGDQDYRYTFSPISVDMQLNTDACPKNAVPSIGGASASISSGADTGTIAVAGSSLKVVDPDGDVLKFSIVAGGGAGYFAIDSSTGDISTTQTNIPAGTYNLTIQVDDGRGGTATSTVTITVESGSVSTASASKPTLAATGEPIKGLLYGATMLITLSLSLKLAPKLNQRRR